MTFDNHQVWFPLDESCMKRCLSLKCRIFFTATHLTKLGNAVSRAVTQKRYAGKLTRFAGVTDKAGGTRCTSADP